MRWTSSHWFQSLIGASHMVIIVERFIKKNFFNIRSKWWRKFHDKTLWSDARNERKTLHNSAWGQIGIVYTVQYRKAIFLEYTDASNYRIMTHKSLNHTHRAHWTWHQNIHFHEEWWMRNSPMRDIWVHYWLFEFKS